MEDDRNPWEPMLRAARAAGYRLTIQFDPDERLREEMPFSSADPPDSPPVPPPPRPAEPTPLATAVVEALRLANRPLKAASLARHLDRKNDAYFHRVLARLVKEGTIHHTRKDGYFLPGS